MKKICVLAASILAIGLLALPAAAQNPQNPYSQVLPDGATQPGDVTVTPDPGAAAPGTVVLPTRTAVKPAGAVTPFRGALPATGAGQVVLLLAVGAVLLAIGGGAVAVSRRRGQATS